MDAEIHAGPICPCCGAVISVTVRLADVRDDEGAWVDVSAELDMTRWHEHQQVRHGARPLG